MPDRFDVVKSYGQSGPPERYDGYMDAYMDGYTVVQTIDGYEQDPFFISADRAWKHRRALDKINLGISQLKELDGYDGYNAPLLEKLFSLRETTRDLVMQLDGTVDKAPYDRILSAAQIEQGQRRRYGQAEERRRAGAADPRAGRPAGPPR